MLGLDVCGCGHPVYIIIYISCCRQDWADHFHPRNLKAFSASPLLVYPTHYVGDAGWYSDTGEGAEGVWVWGGAEGVMGVGQRVCGCWG